jgi:hypothetical protein
VDKAGLPETCVILATPTFRPLHFNTHATLVADSSEAIDIALALTIDLRKMSLTEKAGVNPAFSVNWVFNAMPA